MNNTGGLHSIHLLHRKYFLGVTYMPQSNTYQVQLDANAIFTKLPFTLDTAEFQQKRKKGSEGAYYQIEVNCLVPKNSAEIDKIYRDYDDEDFLLVVQDTNEYYRLIGSQEETFFLSDDQETGTDFSDRNGTKMKFSRKFREPSKFIQSPF